MTEAERDRATAEWFKANTHLWDAWNRLPLAEQAANLDKINAAGKTDGPAAARQMARALGMPVPPDELADPDNVTAARRAEEDQWMRKTGAQLGLSPSKIEEVLSPTPTCVKDH